MILKSIRTNPILNKCIRSVLLCCSRSIIFLQQRWRVSGNINLNFEGVDFKYYSRADDSIADIFFYKTRYAESTEIKIFIKLSAKSKVVFDVGANTGFYSIIAAKANAQVLFYSFEPHPVNADRLRLNVKLNQLHNVSIHQSVVGKENETVEFFIPESNNISDTSSAIRSFSESTYEGKINWKAIIAHQTSLDNFIEVNLIDHIDLIKIDVENYEIMVLDGSSKMLSKFKPVIICEIFLNPMKIIYFNDFLKKYNYIAYMILAEGLVRLDEGLIPNGIGLNYLFSTVRLSKVFTPLDEIDALISKPL